jgi:hypothetical protein
VYKGLLPEVLARVTSRAIDGPRGPDVRHRVKVRREWLVVGEVIELELPRNVTCATCGGGGCDACGRSGAITLRSRSEPAEVVEVTPDSRGITLRIPEQGGLPAEGSDLPRGVLLLTVIPSDAADASVRRLSGQPSKKPPAAIVDGDELETHVDLAAARSRTAIVIVIVAVVLWIAALIYLRFSGRG